MYILVESSKERYEEGIDTTVLSVSDSKELLARYLEKEIREKFPNKTQWLYTGAMWEEINSLEVVKYLDVLCDGEFILAKKDGNAHWVGSTNQRVINVQESRKRGAVVFHEDGCDD